MTSTATMATPTTHCPHCDFELADGASTCPKCQRFARDSSGVGNTLTNDSTPRAPLGKGAKVPSASDVARLLPQLEVEREIGRGGMGVVYLARQPGLDRAVAVKLLPEEIGADAAFAERFQREARSLARLSHPNVVTIYDSGSAEGYVYFVMEYVEGDSLRGLLDAGKLDPEEALALVPQICAGLQFAHDHGIVHRDIKPENLLVTEGAGAGGERRVKIADFGLAKLLGPDSKDATLTLTNQLMGTPHYLAPELLRKGSAKVDERADVYALGVVIYELLTGRLPIGRFAPPSKLCDCEPELDALVLRCLEADPALRFPSAEAVAAALDERHSQPAPILRLRAREKPVVASVAAEPATPEELYRVFDASEQHNAWGPLHYALSIPTLGLVPLFKAERLLRARADRLELELPATLPASRDPEGRWARYRKGAIEDSHKASRRRGKVAVLGLVLAALVSAVLLLIAANPPMARTVIRAENHLVSNGFTYQTVQRHVRRHNYAYDRHQENMSLAALLSGGGILLLIALLGLHGHWRGAERHARNELFLRMLREDVGDLGPEQAREAMRKHERRWARQAWATLAGVLGTLFLSVITLGVMSWTFFFWLTRSYAKPLRLHQANLGG